MILSSALFFSAVAPLAMAWAIEAAWPASPETKAKSESRFRHAGRN
jgi:hypothetical protein